MRNVPFSPFNNNLFLFRSYKYVQKSLSEGKYAILKNIKIPRGNYQTDKPSIVFIVHHQIFFLAVIEKQPKPTKCGSLKYVFMRTAYHKFH